MKSFRTALIALAGIALAGCGTAPIPAGTPPAPLITTAAPPTSADGEQAPRVVDDDLAYRLDSGDQVRITVYGEPELSGQFQLDGQGVIQMSLISEVDAQNKTVRELQRDIEAKLRDGYIREPQVSVEVITYRPYYILGEVNNPGEYPYTSGLTVMNAVASAGDFTYRADKKKILMKSEDSPEEREVDLTLSTPVRPGDTIRIRERFF